MKLEELKGKTELVAAGLLGIAGVFVVLSLWKVRDLFETSARAEGIVRKAAVVKDVEKQTARKYLARYKETAEVLKRKNLFAPPAPKRHPVSSVQGILGGEALINGRWYKVGDKIGDAMIVAIEPTQVRIRWEGKEKVFLPIMSTEEKPGEPRPPVRKGDRGPGRPQGGSGGQAGMVIVGQPETRGPIRPPGPGGFGFPGMDRDRLRQMRERWMHMSEEERERFRAEMRERFLRRRR